MTRTGYLGGLIRHTELEGGATASGENSVLQTED